MDVPAYIMVNGTPPEPKGINTTGLERRGFSKEAIAALRRAYKVLYRNGNTLDAALVELGEMAQIVPELVALIDSIRASKKGILR
jgi:UDP-N-acetylglucosamine acyltransferase